MDSESLFSGFFGLMIGLLLLFVSIVWIIFPFIVMNRLRGIRDELENGNSNTMALIRETVKGNELLNKICASAVPQAAPPQRTGVTATATKLSISRDGENLGRMDIPSVRTLLKRGELSLQDHYFDDEINDWVTLDGHHELC